MRDSYIIFMFLLSFVSLNSFGKEKLFVKLMVSTGNQRAVFQEIRDEFQKLNPDIEVIQNEYEQETYKKGFQSFLLNKNGENDVLFSFSGKNLENIVNDNLVLEIDKNFIEKNFSKSSITGIIYNKKYYAVPLSYYQWGFYYNKSIFNKLHLNEPTTYKEFLQLCKILKNNNITPILLSGKFPWTLAAWFDYFNLRINGIDFHKNLLNGINSYTDPEVLKVFQAWKELIDNGYFNKNINSLEWRQVLPDLFSGTAAMYLIGNFIVDKIPKKSINKIGFFRFPIIDETIGLYEEAPLDVLILPSNTLHKENAIKFLNYIAQSNVLQKLNETIGFISPSIYKTQSKNYFINSGWSILNNTNGITQFYDRDQSIQNADRGMAGFKKFIENPDNLEQILRRIQAGVSP